MAAAPTFSIVIATCGDPEWIRTARERALPTAVAQEGDEVVAFHDPDLSVPAARNAAARETSGSYLVFLDADDELADGYVDALRAAYAAATSPCSNGGAPLETRPVLLVPRVQYVHDDGREQPPEFPNRHAPIGVLNHAAIGTAVPRDLFDRVGGFPDLPIYEDWALWLACKRAGAALLDVWGAVYRAHLADGSRNSGREALDVYWKIRNHHEAETRNT